MYRFIRRLGIIILTLVLVSFSVFLLQSLSPGDSSAYLLAEEAREEERAGYRESMGLDDPFLLRYASFLSAFISGDWGMTANGLDIQEIVMRRFPVTLSLAVISITMALAVSVPLSMLAACNKAAGRIAAAASVAIMSLPSFLTAVFLILIFSVCLGLFPPAGYIAPGDSFTGFMRTMFLPSLALALLHSSLYLRVFRKALAENLAKPFSISMLAMGVKHSELVVRSAFRPSLPVLASLIAGSFVASAAGSAVTETIFAIPGIGSLLVDAALTRDAALSGVLVILIALAVSAANALFELLLFFADPRARRG